jgi:hypothetical protein
MKHYSGALRGPWRIVMEENQDILYHYTTAQGLLGILKKNTLWASNLSTMNDFSELKYAGNLMDKELMKVIEANSVLESQLEHSSFNDFLDIYAAYAVCFCEEGDQLSQWRAYAGKGTGYALGFDRKQLRQRMEEGCSLSKVIYKPEDQKDAIKPSIDKYANAVSTSFAQRINHDSNEEFEEWADIAMDFFKANLFNFLYFKDPSFSEEKEWRIVKITLSEEVPPNMDFRKMQGTVVPYIRMKFSLSDQEQKDLLPIVEIIQGPLIDPALGEKSLRLLLKKYGYDRVDVKRSQVPIRF